uniref:Ion channel n=1 Tax=Desulfovibrio sp. U5L TaxID=596152 RepID=I2PWS7_9BACT
MRRLLFPLANLRERPTLATLLAYKYSITLAIILAAHVVLVGVIGERTVLFAPFILLALYFSGFLLMADRSGLCRAALFLGLAALAATVLDNLVAGDVFLVPALGGHAAFLALLIVIILGRLFAERRMPFDSVMAGVIVFLLMAGLWTQFYGLTVLADPAAIAAPGDSLRLHPYATLYYLSVTALTTAGFGDVFPVSDMARILVAYEGLVGQAYMVVFIALLMGRHFAGHVSGHAAPPEDPSVPPSDRR